MKTTVFARLGHWAAAASLAALGVVGCSSEEAAETRDESPDAGSPEEEEAEGAEGGEGEAASEPKPLEMPAFLDIGLFNASSPFNQILTGDEDVDPLSDAYITKLIEGSGTGHFVLMTDQFTAPVFFAGAETPRTTVPLYCGEAWELEIGALAQVPIPPWAQPTVDTDANDPPQGCGEDSLQDDLMVVIDLEKRCEYDFWQVRREGGAWAASWGAGTSLDGTGVYPHGLSSRASGFAFLGGVIWPDELENGEITHALAFSYPFTRQGGPVAPATDSDGITDDPAALPIGARLRLDPELDIDSLGLGPAEYAVALAMQTYGLILVDTADDSGIALYAVGAGSVAANPYQGLLPAEPFPALENIPLEHLQVLKLPAQNAKFADDFALPDGPCALYE